MEQKLNNKIALITGGNSGIGLATARLFREHGATVIIIGRNPDTLGKVQNELGDGVVTYQADVSKTAEIDRVMERIGEQYGRIDILFANAGISECPEIEDTDEAFFDHIMGINVKGVFFAFTKAMPLFRPGASVIFTSSVSNRKGRPGDPLYAASKAAVRSLVRTLAVHEAVLQKEIRVNAISPGCIQTPLTAQDSPEMQAAIDEYIASSVPMGRWGQAMEVAKAVLFLASEDSSYMTGSDLTVDGGMAEV